MGSTNARAPAGGKISSVDVADADILLPVGAWLMPGVKRLIHNLSREELHQWSRRLDHGVQRQLVILEGFRAVREALMYSGTAPRAVFLTRAWYHHPEITRLLKKRIPHSRGVIYHVTDRQMKQLSRVETPPGLLAVWKVTPQKAWPPASDGVYAYFYEIRDPGNLGTIFRTALAAGIDGIILSPRSVSVHNPKVARGSMSALLRVPFWVRIPHARLLSFHQATRIPLIFVYPAQATPMRSFRWPNRGVLIFGGETARMPPIFYSLPGFHLPMASPMDSLNTAVAASIVFYEWFQRRMVKERKA